MSTPIRSLLAFALIAISVGSLLPPTYASRIQSSRQAQPRRGKNDSTRIPSTSQAEPTQSQSVNQRPQQLQTSRSLNASEPASSDASNAGPVDAEPQSDSGADSQRRRSDPPPFDRPPLGSSQPQDRSPTRREPPPFTRDDRAGGRPSPNTQTPNSSRRQDSDSTDGDIEERNRQRPVLRRDSDPSQDPNQRSGGATQRDQQSQSGGVDDPIKLESTLVNLPMLVSDRSGRYIPQLTKNDFLLYEDGVRQEIASFGSEEVPFSVALMLDVSPSVQGNIDNIQEAAIAFVRQLRPQDRVMVMSFDRRARFLTDFTNDRRILESAISRISTGSGTSVYDAVYETVAHKLRNVEGRKALILFSDGEDTTSSQASYDDAVNIVTESDVLVYGLRYPGTGGGNIHINPWPRFPIPRTQIPFPLPLPFPWPQIPRRRRGPFTLNANPSASSAPQWQRRRGGGGGGDFMADLATAGGGPVFDAEQVGDLTRLATRIAEELRHVYVLSYYPTNPLSNGGYRSIRVQVRGRTDIAVRHRRGYNARNAGPRSTI